MEKRILKQILQDHQLLLEKLNDEVKRDIQPMSLDKQIIVISGVRRCGKSTLMKFLCKKLNKQIVYIKCDDLRFTNFDINDYQKLEETFLELYGFDIILLLDEIHDLPLWEKWVNHLHTKKYSILITGSNSKLLSSEYSTYLTGRHKKINLFPFSFKELVAFKNLDLNNFTVENKVKFLSLFNEYYNKGGFPDVFLNDDIQLLFQYFEDILIKDVILRNKIKQKKELKDLALYLLSNSGKLFSYRSLKSITSIQSFSTIKNYIDYIVETNMMYLLPKYDFSIKKQIVSSSKVYCIDTGFLNHVVFRFSENKGRLLENIVFIELKRRNKEIYYHRDKHECDFVIKKGMKIVEAIQVCYELNHDNKDREIKGLLEAMNKHKLKQGLLLTYDEEDELIIDKKKIIIKPVWKWFLE